MTRKSLEFRSTAKADIETVVDYYAWEAGDAVAFSFIEELGRAYSLLEVTPSAGSPRLGQRLGLEGLRAWQLTKFPYSILYFDRVETVDVWRIIHSQKDLEDALS